MKNLMQSAIALKNGNFYEIRTLSANGLKKIQLLQREPEMQEKAYDITALEKVDNPVLTTYRERLFAAWELYDEHARIVFSIIDPKELSDGDIRTIGIPDDGCYRPRLSSDGENLLLCYEQFTGDHYVIMGRVWLGSEFSEAFELGTDQGNSQEPWLEPLESGFLLSYENSQPLYKNYVWISPAGKKVVIPGFGHGWRVETRMFLKRVTVEEGNLVTTVPGAGQGRIFPAAQESSGCPRVMPLADGTLVAVFCSMGDKVWRILFSRFDGTTWSDASDTGLKQSRRITPCAQYDQGKDILTICAEHPETGELQQKEISLNTNDEKQRLAPDDFFGDRLVCRVYREQSVKKLTREINYQGQNLKLLWGDLHMHSNLSPCSLHPKFHCVELEEKYRQSRDVGRLDFAMCTDHDTMTDDEWERTKSEADFHNRPGSFTSFQGFEWTATHGPGPKQGHYNVLYRDTGRLYRVSEEDGAHITYLWDDMEKGRVLTIPHHPADETHQLDWQFFDPDFEPLVEIFQVRGSYEYPGNSMDPSLYRDEKMVPGSSILEALEMGYRFGFTSGGEHEGVGTTAVFAEENTRDALFDALTKRQVYGTTGEHIFMDFRVNGTLMGGEISGMSGNPEMKIRIDGTAPIKELRIMRDGKKIFSESYPESQLEVTWTDKGFADIMYSRKVHYYYLAVEQENGEIGWASPVFIKM